MFICAAGGSGTFNQMDPMSAQNSCSMSQPRVTDYFTRRKKGIAGGAKPATRRSRLGCRSSAISAASTNKDLFPSPVHEEFVRVIDEAVGLNGGTSIVTTKNPPRTPKRTSDVVLSTTDASTAKKRQVDGHIPEKGTKKNSRKKLVLPPDSPPVTVYSPVKEDVASRSAERITSSSPTLLSGV